MNKIIKIKRLKIKKGNKIILDINREIFILSKDKVAILGENGSGKTTLINAILGEIDFEGEIVRNFKKLNCGIIFQDNSYNDLLKVSELILLVLRFKKERMNNFLGKYELNHLKKKYIRDLSIGEKQRLTLSLVLESNKSIYFFDELTTGLDYKKRFLLLDIMKKKTVNGTVLNITHYFEEIENWATRIIILKQGKLFFFGSVSDFFLEFEHYSIIKISYNELLKLQKNTIENTKNIDIGDSKVFVFLNNNSQIDTEKFLQKKNISYTIIKQNIYTTYLIASSMNEYSKY